ncbi:MAG: proteasome subunit beta [Thermoplasmata archaeon]|nr:proteasome subunit beta [Candidatus Sysuiplasma acidicola]MBX8646427.1 proteasome subunit beta [Candidatus Sysuiplasma acidicola]MDH2905234.1 proteasome subunit beta [Methanomassiliicoccales archaeon]
MQNSVQTTGTTTLGFKWSEGVIVATDRRATMDTMISSKTTTKLHRISEHIVATIAGGLGDSQHVIRVLQAESNIFRFKNGTEISVGGISTLLANMLNQTKFYPEYTFPIVAGVDRTGSHVYSVDPAGGSEEDDFISVGSGSPYVYGVMEDRYRSTELSQEDGFDLAIRALCSALKRDAATGNGIDVVSVSKKEFYKWPEKEVNKTAAKYGMNF